MLANLFGGVLTEVPSCMQRFRLPLAQCVCYALDCQVCATSEASCRHVVLIATARVLAREESSSHWALCIPQYLLDHLVPGSPLHPPHLRTCRRKLQDYARGRLGHPPWSCWIVDGRLVASHSPSCVLCASSRWKAAVAGCPESSEYAPRLFVVPATSYSTWAVYHRFI